MLCPCTLRAIVDQRRHYNIGKCIRILVRKLLPRLKLIFEHGQLGQQNRRLHRIETTVQTNPRDIVFGRAFPMRTNRTINISALAIVSQKSTAIPKARKRLCREN